MKLPKILSMLLLFTTTCDAQNSLLNIVSGLREKRTLRAITKDYYFNNDTADRDSHTMNYVQSLVNYFANHSIQQTYDIDSFGEVCQMFTMVGNYKRAIRDNEMSFPYGNKARQDDIKGFATKYYKNISITQDCEKYLIEHAAKAPITMINEAHDYPFTRVYIMSLLDKFKRAGYTYLAMEALGWDGNLNAVDQSTGFYTSEPVMGELVRYALKLGYQLVPYEATMTADMTSIQRDSLEAKNIISAMQTHKNGKFLVIAGYDHINETITDTAYFQPMAYFFKKWSGLDPFTIEQTNLTECGADELSRTVYKYLPNNVKQKTSCIKTDDLYYKHYINSKNNQERDVYLIHPSTHYVNGRPTWLTLNGQRKRFRYIIPAKILNSTVLVQAYYAKEVLDKSQFDKKVPADQMMFESKNVDFYLTPHNDYIIVCRDINNQIISQHKLHT